MRLIVILAFERANLLDISGPLQVFATAAEEPVGPDGELPYEVAVVSLPGGMIATSCGLPIFTRAASEFAGRRIDTLLVSGGGGAQAAATDPAVLSWLADQARHVRRVGSICTGAFIMAAAGVLHDRRATTHWEFCDALGDRYPDVCVEDETLFVEDDGVWTSAGVTAGIDMALAMVENDLGSGLALQTARTLVLFLKRTGGQPQFSAALRAQTIRDENLRRLAEWMLEHPGENLETAVLARRANMSQRTLFRAFKEHLATTPREFVERVRLEAARHHLEQSDDRLDGIARRAGFASTDAMRSAFQRRFKISPTSYRERFSTVRTRVGDPETAAGRPLAPPSSLTPKRAAR